jgi:putative nucleotidyltransferase with HDIG domain
MDASIEAQSGDELLAQVVQLLRVMGTPAYLVGGTVRDQLLGAPQTAGVGSSRPYDLDLAVPGDGLRVARQVADALGAAYYPLDAERGVGRIVLGGPPWLLGGPAWLLGGHATGVRVVDVARFQGPDLEADLAGRDFTVNAMALDLGCDPPALIDPYGGQADLETRQLRAVSDRAMHRDPVRGLRAVRLAAELGFEIEPRTQSLIRAAAPGLGSVSAERVRDELVKILSLPAVADSLRRLDGLDLLAQTLPEVTALKGLDQTGHHRWDAYEHTLQTAAALERLLPLKDGSAHPDVPFPEQVSQHLALPVTGGYRRRLLLTLAALLHDIGKPETATLEPDGRTRFVDHERVGAALAADALRRLRFAGNAVRLVETIVRHHLRPLQLMWQGVVSRRAVHRFFRATGDAGVDIGLLSLADHQATLGGTADDDQWPLLLRTVGALLDAYFNRQEAVVSPAPVLTGRDLMDAFGLSEGPLIGRLLSALREAQAMGVVTSRAEAEEWVRRKLGEGG